jgi:hypothetical protein
VLESLRRYLRTTVMKLRTTQHRLTLVAVGDRVALPSL